MKTLYLLRHAKSSWDDPGLDDHERPLAARGERASQKMGAYLERKGVAPDLVLCSSARRAQQTLAQLRPQLPAAEVRIEPCLYAASPEALQARLRQLDESVERVLVLGHEPGLSQLACGLALDDGSKARRRLEQKFPTAACAELHLEISDWSEIEPGSGRLVRFRRPRDLT